MEALKRFSLAFAVAVFGTVGCGDDDGDGDPKPDLDAGNDSGVDANMSGDSGGDASKPSACRSNTMPTATQCGGVHCDENLSQLTARKSANAVCSKPEELDSLCQNESPAKVQACAVEGFFANKTGAELAAYTKTCSTTALPDHSSGCLDCFVAGAMCAASKCLDACGADASSIGCDTCRVQQGCISAFYTCIGLSDPTVD